MNGAEWFGAIQGQTRFMNMQYLIPICGIIAWCVIIIMDYRRRKDLFTLHHQERMAAIEKGIEPPPMPEGFLKGGGFFGEESEGGKLRSLHSDFGWGLFWLLGGLATLVALYFNFNGKVALFALIPIAIGLHHLIYYYAIGKKEAAAREAERAAKASPSGRDSIR